MKNLYSSRLILSVLNFRKAQKIQNLKEDHAKKHLTAAHQKSQNITRHLHLTQVYRFFSQMAQQNYAVGVLGKKQ